VREKARKEKREEYWDFLGIFGFLTDLGFFYLSFFFNRLGFGETRIRV